MTVCPARTVSPRWLVVSRAEHELAPLGPRLGERERRGDRVADPDGADELHLVARGDAAGRRQERGHPRHHRGDEADQEGAVGDAPAESRPLGELLVDVHAREVAGDAGEEVHVGLAERLADGLRVAEGDRAEGGSPVARRPPHQSRSPTPHPPST